jgi:hypothetical protein
LRDSAGLSPASPFSPSIRAVGTSAENYSVSTEYTTGTEECQENFFALLWTKIAP